MQDLAVNVGFSLLVALLSMTCVFVIARFARRYDVIDIAWGLVFISIAIVAYFGQDPIELGSVQTVAFVLIILWGLRLTAHIYARWERSGKEDRRYQQLRETYAHKAGGVGVNMFGKVYMLQAVLAVIVMLPFIVSTADDPRTVGPLAILGILVWLIGFAFETVGDWQLANYQKAEHGKRSLMTSGLWKYTRHPNYFGEVVQWWGVFLVVCLTPYWYVALVGPLVITVLILFVSGVPLTEKHFEGRAGWSAYKRRTSAFLPLPPKKG